ncbi:MAG: VCBS repeat-containing protein, partial [Nitrospina sp.]|nr:VCBS repeat-containing protein [Nitrospina sp.]
SFVYPHFNYVVGSQPRSITGADFNHDGMMDIAVVLYQKQILEVFIRTMNAPLNDV